MSVESLAQYLDTTEDPRCGGEVAHHLRDVLVVAVCAVIACAGSWDGIALYGRSKPAWLRTFLDLPNGIPSHGTFRRVFVLTDPDAFEAGFAAWAGSLADRLEREVAAIDGKTIRRSSGHVKLKLTRSGGAFHAFAGGLFHADHPSPVFAGVQAADH